MTEIDDLRRRGILLIMIAGWATNIILAALSIGRGEPDDTLAALVGCIINIVPTLCVVQRRCDGGARAAVAMMVALEPGLLLYVMRGAAWQVDMHMYFFVGLASLTILCDWKPLAIAGMLVALHHLVLALVAPTWVFAGGGGLGRVLVHALAVGLQCAVLIYIATRLAQTITAQSDARQHSEQLAADANAAKATAETARARAEEALTAATAAQTVAADERGRRQKAEIVAAETRRNELLRVAGDFERSIAGVAMALGDSARSLEGSATALNVVAQDAGQKANDVATAAVEAAEASRSVAGGVGTLARSISIIADSVSQQAKLTDHARSRSTLGDAAVQTLASSSGDVGGLADAIATIASRTDMLALNATIEAARAGAAGYGFAVVAQEVKALAAQAGSATQQIADLVSGINARASDANGNFRQVSTAIVELADAADAIRSEIDEQRSATRAIEHHADEAAAGMIEMTRRVEGVSDAASSAERLSGEVRCAAGALLEQVRALQNATDGFVTMLRVA